MIKKELKKASGDVCFEVSRTPDTDYICVNWVGIQSLETMVMGGNHVLLMLKKESCKGILNSNRELIGPWEVAINWLVQKWAPEASALGLVYYAHVLSPGIYGRRSFELMHHSLSKYFEVQTFENETEAETWLKQVCA